MQQNPSPVKVALITGAARRIGAEIARALHQAGLNIILHYHTSEEEAVGLAQQLNQARPNSATAIGSDLLELENCKSLIDKSVKVWERLDVLVNNASRFYRTALGKVTAYAWDDLMNSNLKAPFFLAQAAAPYLAACQGSIVNITDIHADRPLRNYSVYCISKSGLLMATRVLAKELGPLVRVNAVAPGPIIWPEGENVMTEQEKQKVIDQTMLKRPGSPEDIAKAVLFFVRDADYVTGQILEVDGGRMLSGG